MKDWLQKILSETSPLGKVAFRISLILLGASALSVLVYSFVYTQTPAWQVSGLIAGSVLLGLLCIYSAVIAWDSRHRTAIEILIVGTGFLLLLIISWFVGVGLVLGLGFLIFTIAVAGETLTKSETPRLIGIGLFFGLAMYLLDIFAGWERLSIPIVQTFLPLIVAIILLIESIQVFRQFPKYSIRTKFVAVLSGISLLSIIVVSFISNQIFSALTNQALNQNLKTISYSNAKEVELIIGQNIDRLNVLALNRFIQDSVDAANIVGTGNNAVLSARDEQWQIASNLSPLVANVLDNEIAVELRELQRRYPKIVEIFVTDRYGAVIASTIKTSDYYQADEEWWQSAWNNGKGGVYISQPTFDQNTKSYAIEISMPIPGHDRSDLVGIIRSTVDISELSGLLARSQFGETGHSDLYFGNNQYINDDPSKGLIIYSDDIIETITQPGLNINQTVYEGYPSIVASSQVTSDQPELAETIKALNWYVITHQNVSEAQAPLESTTRTVTLISIALLMGVIFLSVALANQFTRPLERLTAAATKLSAGEIDTTVLVQSEDEFGTLANTFNFMSERLKSLISSLEQRVTDRTKALTTATEVSRRLSTILDERQLVTEVVEQVQKAYNYYHGQIYLLDASGQTLVLAGATGAGGKALLDKKHSLSVEKGLVGRVARTKAAVLVPDTSQNPEWLPNPLLPDTKAEIAIPILLGEKLLGVLDMQDDVVGDIYPEDVEYLTAIANQTAIALQNARSLAQAQKKADREELITTISQRIQQETTMENAMKVAVREVGRALGTSAAVKLKPGNGKPQGERDV